MGEGCTRHHNGRSRMTIHPLHPYNAETVHEEREGKGGSYPGVVQPPHMLQQILHWVAFCLRRRCTQQHMRVWRAQQSPTDAIARGESNFPAKVEFKFLFRARVELTRIFLTPKLSRTGTLYVRTAVILKTWVVDNIAPMLAFGR